MSRSVVRRGFLTEVLGSAAFAEGLSITTPDNSNTVAALRRIRLKKNTSRIGVTTMAKMVVVFRDASARAVRHSPEALLALCGCLQPARSGCAVSVGGVSPDDLKPADCS